MGTVQLMAHQKEGIDFLVGRKSGLLAFEQGLGKTLVAVEAFLKLRAAGMADTLVVVCPNSIKRTWAVEVARFTPELAVCIVEGSAKERRRLLSSTRAAVVLLNYETARNEIVSVCALMRRTRAALVLDESHNVKNLVALNTIAAQHFAPLAEYRWLLSGTPAPNSPVDIYSQVALVAGASPFGPFQAFISRYGDADKVASQRDELAQKISPYVLRRTKEQCLDLPDKTFIDLFVELPAWQRRLYDGMRDGLIREVGEMSREEFARFAPTALTKLLRLSQVASNPTLIFPDESRLPGKVVELDRIIAEIVSANGRKIIIWSYYVGTIERLALRYKSLGATTLYGGTPSEERQEVVRRFQEDPGTRILVANPAAAGAGFTLTAANYTIYETLNWRYDLYAQSQDRNHRIGQAVPVTYIRLTANGTIDHVIAEALGRKEGAAQALVGDPIAAASIPEMSPEEFCSMLKSNALPLGPGGLN